MHSLRLVRLALLRRLPGFPLLLPWMACAVREEAAASMKIASALRLVIPHDEGDRIVEMHFAREPAKDRVLWR